MTEIRVSVRKLTLHISNEGSGEKNENCSDDPCNSPHNACIIRYARGGNEENTDQKQDEVMMHQTAQATRPGEHLFQI